MPSSDEDFESADEGHSNVDRKERKKRLSSSNYSDNLESDQEFKTPIKTNNKPLQTKAMPVAKKETDGWDDFDIEESEPVDVKKPSLTAQEKEPKPSCKTENKTSDDTGWDDFGDWGQDDGISNIQKEQPLIQQAKTVIPQPKQDPAPGGWGWGWSVDSLLSSATAGISNITTQVSQGISTVLETGIGAPDPVELARASKEAKESQAKAAKESQAKPRTPEEVETEGGEEASGSGGDAFQLGSLLSGVTKFVESTGNKVLAGGLDTLETIGKKTMEVLQDGDPGLAKKRAMLGLDSGDKPILSQVLREAKAKADEEDQIREVKREAKEVHYETLFDDFEGLVHLEALEMLSKQTSMRIEEKIRAADPDKRQDMKETLQQVAELCEMPEDDDDDDDSSEGEKVEAFHEKLQTATQDLGLKLQFQPLIKQYTEILEWLDKPDATDKSVYKRCVSALAQTTALSVLTYHKTAELLLTKQRRSTADEADALTQMTVVLRECPHCVFCSAFLSCAFVSIQTRVRNAYFSIQKRTGRGCAGGCAFASRSNRVCIDTNAPQKTQCGHSLTKHISELATLFTEKLNSLPSEDKEQTNNYITNIFLEAGNSSSYVQNAFLLALPILQIGAV